MRPIYRWAGIKRWTMKAAWCAGSELRMVCPGCGHYAIVPIYEPAAKFPMWMISSRYVCRECGRKRPHFEVWGARELVKVQATKSEPSPADHQGSTG